MADALKNNKRLVMVFGTDGDRNVSITVDNPKTSLSETEIKACMQTIVDKAIFAPKEEEIIKMVEAKIVVTNTNEYDLA